MSVQDDPLMKPQEPDRLYYAFGAMLDREDFVTEQTYHRGRLGRALAYLHGTGTVAGLQAVVESQGDALCLQVEPGLALDPLGRLIELPRSQCLMLDAWYQEQLADSTSKARLSESRRTLPDMGEGRYFVVLDLFIKFVACAHAKEPAFASGAYDALDAVAPSRVRDYCALTLAIRTSESLPAPVPSLPDLSGMSREQAREAVCKYKLEESWRADRLRPREWHVAGQDGSELLLARLFLEVKEDTLERVAGGLVTCDNYLRQFSYSTAELAWAGAVLR